MADIIDPDWEDAVFDVSVLADSSQVVLPAAFAVEIVLSSLNIPKIGSELFGTEYGGVPIGNFDFPRKVDVITILKYTGINIVSIVFFSDFQNRIQVPMVVLDNTPDFIRVRLTQSSTGKLIIF